jgi:hypothetical protein
MRVSVPRPARRLPFLFLAVGAVTLSSCGRDGRIPVHPVRGQVLFDGRPTPHALVVFHPVADLGREVPRPSAKVGADGSFTLTTFAGKDGAPEGEYKVTVQWFASTAPKTAREGENYAVVNRLPQKYATARATPLTARVTHGDNEIPAFRLGK